MSGRKWANGRGYAVSPATKEARREASQEAATECLRSVLALFECEQELPEAVATLMIARIEGLAPMASWSLGNQLLVLQAGSTDARGYRQWEAVGRHVAKGERAIFILGPVTRKIRDKDATTGDETTRTVVTGFKRIPVFAYESTGGSPIERENFNPPEVPPLREVATALGVSVEYAPAPHNCTFAGFYQPSRERIVLVTHQERTFFHELAHAAHARILRARGSELKAGPHAEIVAETVAATLCQLYGFDGYVYDGKRYVADYAESIGLSAERAAFKCLSDIQAALYLIVEEAVAAGASIPTRDVAAA
jgi:antirestriction protein ArdC